MKPTKIEYKVRKMERYFVTRYEETERDASGVSAGSSGLGEYDNQETAYAVAYALCKQEHETLGWPMGDERIQYPAPPSVRVSPSDEVATQRAIGRSIANRTDERKP